MSVLVVGLTHRKAPVELLERLAFDTLALPKALHQLTSGEHVREGAILSTCNRVEVYVLVTGYHAGLAELRRFLSEFHHVPSDEFGELLESRYEEDAVGHLFSVAAGIESMVVGEPQILAQVREAFRIAGDEGAAGPVLSALFRNAIRVGRRARAETAIGKTVKTFAGAGADLARAALGSLDGATVLVVGAGKMSDIAARRLVREGATVLVANRTPARARALAERIGGKDLPMTSLAEGLAAADLVLSSTGAPEPVITRDMVADAVAARGSRPLVLLDLAVPRDVDPEVSSLDGVVLRDLDDLREGLKPGPEQLFEGERVREIVADEIPKFTRWQRAHHLAPLLEALQTRGEDARVRELRRAAARLEGLTQRQREAVEMLTRSIVAKLLHDPVTALKRAAGTTEGEGLARALRDLFDLLDGTR
ncbi:MAG: glutamyl-tRNA reductase [Actinobacteria bacterium]|nr:MAG: glutamyl-tRNA reductase [Actinomycetota bacterium]